MRYFERALHSMRLRMFLHCPFHRVLKQSDSEAYLWARRAANKGLSKAEYAVG